MYVKYNTYIVKEYNCSNTVLYLIFWSRLIDWDTAAACSRKIMLEKVIKNAFDCGLLKGGGGYCKIARVGECEWYASNRYDFVYYTIADVW
jgi:hypothetical protein